MPSRAARPNANIEPGGSGEGGDYSTLTPSLVLDALDAVGLRGDGRILQLNSYENRVFQVFLEDGTAVVAKFYRPGRWSAAQILEEHRFALELAEAEVPVVPPLLLSTPLGPSSVDLLGVPATLARHHDSHGTHRFAVAARCAGREPELDDPDTLRQIGRFIGRLHAVGRRRPFEHRHRMQARVDGPLAVKLLVDGGFVADDQRATWESACRQALALVDKGFSAVPTLRALRLHGDCHPGNVLWRDGAPHVVDLDDACTGPAVQDLWMLVSGDASSMQRQLALLLDGYTQFSDFDERELRLIEPLRTLRMVRHSAWLAARWNDPTFPLNFPFFGSSAYWSQQTTQLREQVEAMTL